MRLKIEENNDGTFSLYNQTDKIYIQEKSTKKEIIKLKKNY
jgi:hypothetical protein